MNFCTEHSVSRELDLKQRICLCMLINAEGELPKKIHSRSFILDDQGYKVKEERRWRVFHLFTSSLFQRLNLEVIFLRGNDSFCIKPTLFCTYQVRVTPFSCSLFPFTCIKRKIFKVSFNPLKQVSHRLPKWAYSVLLILRWQRM